VSGATNVCAVTLFSTAYIFVQTSARIENQMPGRRFPAPWSSEEHASHFVVRDNNGQAVAYVYYENQPVAGQQLSY
jgi:hypothetical protein